MASIESKALSCKHHDLFFVYCRNLLCSFSRVQIHKKSNVVQKLNTYYWFKGMRKALCGCDHDFHLM